MNDFIKIPLLCLMISLLSSCFAVSTLDSINNIAQKAEWSGTFNSTGGETLYSASFDSAGSYYATGSFEATVDFDPSSGISNLSSPGARSMYLTKFNSKGELLWAKLFGDAGSTGFYPRDVEIDSTGNIVLFGNFQGSMDADPGVGVSTLSSNGSMDMYLIKLDSAGDFVFGYQFGNTGYDEGQSMTISSTDDIAIIGVIHKRAGDTDFDPTAGTDNKTGFGNYDLFVTKINSNNSYAWTYYVGGTSKEWAGDLEFDGTGNIVLAALYEATTDFDPSVGTSTHTAKAGYDIAVVKLNSSGAYQSSVTFGGDDVERVYGLGIDISGNVFISGSFKSSDIDLNPGAGSKVYSAVGENDIYILSLDSSLNYRWGFALGTVESDRLHDLKVSPAGNIYVTGYFGNSMDVDPGADEQILQHKNPVTNDVCVIKYDNFGKLKKAYTFGGEATDSGWALDTLNGKVLVGGNYDSSSFKMGLSDLKSQSYGGGTDSFLFTFEE